MLRCTNQWDLAVDYEHCIEVDPNVVIDYQTDVAWH